MRRPIVFAACLAAALALLPSRTRGEVFILKSGGRIEGEHLNPDRQRGQPYQLRTSDGIKLALADNAVHRVIVKSDLDKQYEALLAKLENTVVGQWNLAEWCKEAGLTEQRKRHLAAIIALDPNHEDARKALGYQRYGSRWLTQEQHMESLGYIKYKGAWRTNQEVEIENHQSQQDLAVKKLRKDIRMWFEHLAGGGRLADAANRNLNALHDPEAAPALAEILGDSQQPRVVRQRCLDILGKLPTNMATPTLKNIALADPDPTIQDACLDRLKEQGAYLVIPVFLNELKNKDNARVNRAADCLQRLGDKSATLPLINALVTEHKYTVNPGSAPGSMTPNFGTAPGAGGLSMGSKAVTVKEARKNPSVRSALTSLYPGVNFDYDIAAWRAWYSQSQTTSSIDLRRDD